MAATVGELMTRNPVTLKAESSLVVAAKQMRDQGIGAVLVTKDGVLCGMVTDRDITIRAVSEGEDPNRAALGDICSQELTTVTPASPVSEAIKLMRDKTLRRLSVVEGSKPVGIISLGDLALAKDPKSVLASISAAEPNDLALLARLRLVEQHGIEDDRLKGSLIDGIAFAEIDGPDRVAVEPRVEELLRILDAGALGEGEPDGILERLPDADDSTVRPDRDSRRVAGLLPLDLFDQAGVGLFDQGA